MLSIGINDKITAAERYAKATGSSDLTPNLSARCDADKLIAAGWATQGDPRRAAALALYRMAIAGNTQGLQTVVDTMDRWLNGKLQRKGGRPIPKGQRLELVSTTLRWWIGPVCGYCEGRAFELLNPDDTDGAKSLSGRACISCHGTGKRPLAREVPGPFKDHAQGLADELDRLVLLVTAEMARVLSDRMPSLELRR